MDRNIRIATLALFIAMAVALHWIESFIPRPAPFLRFGLANILTLCTLYTFGGLWALFVVISRVVIGSALAGSIFSPVFAFSLSGGVAAAVVMWAMPKTLFSPIGVSVGGAAAHMSAQLALAVLLVAHMSLTHILPIFLLVSVITGVVNGYCVVIVLDVMKGRQRRFTSP
ncbi:MAG: Heptaprenyl diphosphate synthase component I [Deltaproteobacteria bacterium ADurb.BinA179]|jgi:heptaprenyl diphosphate synthase|nr:Gx transporter family protein [Deltaproteobacteria bacterium]MDI9542584.1 Gx transporter family protein [Pseudomonadota bacterium]NLW66881.1 Gx transporter family protein [Bacteriovoracaceae bacterium]OPZ28353.1 MAG: Heptaprenyl diphosphate synthase component I [Deltaproteobacteria bacterium ADurb.BinA179]HRR21286.1 Gx transporter family protein [Desulfomonilia bacterium]